ncbi:MAG: hypothetical protein MAG431_00941 [Chloroflexi bacterium]|nr:hypothetical protein [Chloroflexota bacterium]
MKKKKISITNKNLDRFSKFLTREIKKPALSDQIPSEAHIFHGAYNDANLTQANLEMATNIMLGMTLGYVKEAPLIMIFEHQPNQEMVINLSSESRKKSTQEYIHSIHIKNQLEFKNKINELVAA